ncbi:hypothetical protein ACX3YG_21670 [Pseudomonas wadenswilerensis]
MKSRIYDEDGLVVFELNGLFYVRYDAGAHQVVVREDEISEKDARRIMAGHGEANKVMFELQRRLETSGVNPYVSNVKW